MKRLFTLAAFFVSIGLQAQIVTGFDGEHHTGGSTEITNVDFPADLSNVSQILMHVSLDCPSGGCDPWDRFASLKVDLGWQDIEIGRYVTPYGNSWCDWTIDVTEYREFLSGNTDLTSHIETWENGWLINTSFEFIAGTPDYPHISVQNLWTEYDFTYGDTVFYSINLPEQTVEIPANAEEVIFRIVNTGHGQGNTENAAEFSQKTHAIKVNGSTEFTQFLWKDDCNANPCSPQGGTWQFARAGWCPGQDVQPDDYDITSLVTPGQTATLDYVLEPFLNECSPWNIDCEDGVTCTACNYNSNGHTTPHYKIVGQLIVKSSSPLPSAVSEVERDLGLLVYPNPTVNGGPLNIQMNKDEAFSASVFDLSGKQLISKPLKGKFNTLGISELSAGIYLVRIQNETFNITKKVIIN